MKNLILMKKKKNLIQNYYSRKYSKHLYLVKCPVENVIEILLHRTLYKLHNNYLSYIYISSLHSDRKLNIDNN